MECGLVTVDPLPSSDELSAYYEDAFYGQPSSASGTALRFFHGRRAAMVRRHHSKVRSVLDVGCGDGGFLAHLAQQGVVVTGVETSASGAARARARIGTVLEALPTAGAFDVVTAWHVLEHVPAPRPFLTQLRGLSAEGGIVVVAVPNFDSLEARLGGDAWFHLDVPRHLHHFSPSSLQRLMRDCGFEIIGIETFSAEYGPFGFLQTALNLLPIERNALYQFAKHGRPLSSFKVSTAATTLVAGVVGGVASLGATALQAALGRGNTITVVARAR